MALLVQITSDENAVVVIVIVDLVVIVIVGIVIVTSDDKADRLTISNLPSSFCLLKLSEQSV